MGNSRDRLYVIGNERKFSCDSVYEPISNVVVNRTLLPLSPRIKLSTEVINEGKRYMNVHENALHRIQACTCIRK